MVQSLMNKSPMLVLAGTLMLSVALEDHSRPVRRAPGSVLSVAPLRAGSLARQLAIQAPGRR